MADKHLSLNSLKNLSQANHEARRLSRESLETALLLLLEEKSLAQISISELTTKAGVSRNAFYRHYPSKEAILEHILTSIVRRIFRGIKAFNLKTQAYQAWLYLFREAKKEAKILMLAFEQHLDTLLTKIVAKRIKAYQKFRKKHQSAYATSFFSNAIVSLLSNWFRDGLVVSEEDMAAMELPLFT